MKDTIRNIFANITMATFIEALRENARRKHVKKSPKQYSQPHRHPGIRSPKIAAQMNAMHDRWYASRFSKSD